MIDNFKKQCIKSKLSTICDKLENNSRQALAVNNGNIPRWDEAINAIKKHPKGKISYQEPYLYIDIDIENENEKKLQSSLKKLIPWRKGPYQIGGLQLDSEWRGDMKWNRVLQHIQPLKGRNVLDVGSGNGYFTYLMALEGAKIALGIEPFLLFNYQFNAIRSLINNPPNAFVLPIKLEQMPTESLFDTVFSMGVLYHQKQHLLHLQQLKNVLTNGGELVLETLVIDEKYGKQIIPKQRYARMRNIGCLPSIKTLFNWLEETGFKDIKMVNITKTTPKEQRATHWIGDNTQSLEDFLDPDDTNLTIEGLPAPNRAIFICQK